MRVLIDTNVVLDFLQEREPFVEAAAKPFEQIDDGKVDGFVTATTITNIYYIVRKAAGSKTAIDALTQIITDLHICVVDRNILQQAVNFGFQDFEDAVQYACAMVYGVDAIVTRDTSGFTNSEIPVIAPDQLDIV